MAGQTEGIAPQQRHRQDAAAASVVVDDPGQVPQEDGDVFFRVEQLLQERIPDALRQRRALDRDNEACVGEEVQAAGTTAESALLPQDKNSSNGLWLTPGGGVSATDASAALECLQVVRECVTQSSTAAAAASGVSNSSSSCAVRPPVYLSTLLQCIRGEAAAARNNSRVSPSEDAVTDARNAASRIPGGMALLLVLLLQQLSSEDLHRYIHSDPKLLVLLLQTIDACSVLEEEAEGARGGGCSPRPVLLLLAALQQCFSAQRQHPSGDRVLATSTRSTAEHSSNSSSSNYQSSSVSGCSCFPARGVWLQLLKLLTQDIRACVRHRARQTAQSLLHAAAAAAGAPPAAAGAPAEAPGAAAASEAERGVAAGAPAAGRFKRQQHARASLGACVAVLEEYISNREQYVESPFLRREEQALQKTYFLRSLPFLRRVLASLLQLPLSLRSSEPRSNGSRRKEKDEENGGSDSARSIRQGAQAEEEHQVLLHAVQSVCMRTAFSSKREGGFTEEAAQALRCVADAVKEALHQQLLREGLSDRHQQQQRAHDELYTSGSRGVDGSGRFATRVSTLLLLPVTGKLLSGLLRQQCGGSTCKGRRGARERSDEEKDSSSSGGVWLAATAAPVTCSNKENGGSSSSSASLSQAAAQARGTLSTAGAAQYAAAWCEAVSTALDILTQWTGLPVGGETVQQQEDRASGDTESHNKHTASAGRKGSSGLKTSGSREESSRRAEGSGASRDARSVEDEETDTALLLEQLQRLSLLPREAQGAAGEQDGHQRPHHAGQAAAAPAAAARDTGTDMLAGIGGRGARQQAAAAEAGRRHPYANRVEIFSRAWTRVLKCLCDGLAAVRDASVAAAVGAAGRRLVEQATLLELPLLQAAVPYCLALLHYKQKPHWRDGLQQAAQLLRSLEIVALKQFARGSPSFPQLQPLACRLLQLQLHEGDQQPQQQQLGQHPQPPEGKLTEYMGAFADLHHETFAPLLDRIVTLLALVEAGVLPANSSNSRRNDSVRGVHSNSSISSGSAEEGGLLASLQRRDLAVYRGDIRSCFAAALHAFTCRVMLSRSLLPLVFFMDVGDLSPTDLVVFDERAAAAQAAESCRISASGRSPVAAEWCSNSWLLPLLPSCLKRDRMELFAVYFLPLAQQLQQQARQALAAGKPLLARELCRLQQQVWGLLPGFCCQPLDLVHALSSQRGAKLFDTMLQLLHEPVLRQDICAAIVNLCAAVAVPPCAAAAAAAAAVCSRSAGPASSAGAPTEAGAQQSDAADSIRISGKAAATGSAGGDAAPSSPTAVAALQMSRRRAAALAAVLRSAVQKGGSSHVDDDAVSALAAVAGSSCRDGRRLLQMRAASVIGFLVVRFLQLHKLPAAGTPGGQAAAGGAGGATTPQQQRSFLAAMLLGETESVENLTQSAKMKAAQHLLRATKAYAPLCPKEVLQANVRRFTSAFLNRATIAAAALCGEPAVAAVPSAAATAGSGAAATAVLGPTETAALVDIADALLPVLSDEFTVEMLEVMRELLDVCVKSLKKRPGSPLGLVASAATGGGGTTHAACSAVEALVHRQVLQMLLRRAYKTLKHMLERSLEGLQQRLQQTKHIVSEQQQQLLLLQSEHQQPSPPPRQQQQGLPQQLPAPLGQHTGPAVQTEERNAAVGNSLLKAGETTNLLVSSQLLGDLWQVLEPGRTVSWAASAEKARLGCLRVFMCYCLTAQARAEGFASAGTESSFFGLPQRPQSDTPAAAGVSRASEGEAAEWGALLEKTLPVLVPEILLCLKTPNRVVRETALDTLSAVAEACEHDREKLSKLVLSVAAGLGGCFEGDPPLLKAAASLALSRLVFSFSEEMGEDLVTDIADVVLVMLEDDNTPVFLGALHFAKVLTHALDAEQLEPFLPRILNLFESKAITRARRKIRRLLEKLLKKLGDRAVEAAFPQKHLPLLRHLQRRMRRQQLRDLLCSAALQEGLSWEDLDFGNSVKTGEGIQQLSGQSTKHSRRKHAKENFAATLEEDEEDEDEDDSEDDDEEDGKAGRSQKTSQKKSGGVTSKGRRKETSRSGDTAAGDEKGDPAAVAKSEAPASMYLQALLDAAEAKDFDQKPGGKKRVRNRAAIEPVSLTEDRAGDTPVDLLSPAAAEHVLLSRDVRKRRRQGTSYADRNAPAREEAARSREMPAAKEEIYWNEEGRLVVVDAEERGKTVPGKRFPSAASAQPDAKGRIAAHLQRLSRDTREEKTRENKRPSLSCLAARRAAAKAARQQKRGGHFVQQGGEAFKSKKGRGDVMKNKKVEPYAYIRLNPAMIREKYRPKALKSLSTVFAKPAQRAKISSISRGVQKTRQKRSGRSGLK